MKLNLKNYSKPLTLILALILVSPIFVGLASGFIDGQTANFADYVIKEGTAGSDYYDSVQYSYKINQWAYEYRHLSGYSLSDVDPDNDWFDAEKSLRLGFTEFGEFASEPGYAGIAYGADAAEWADTESWASELINSKYWIQGWTFFLNYTRQTERRAIEAWAIYSDLAVSEAGRGCMSWKGQYGPGSGSAQLTPGTIIPSGVQVLYDSARLGVLRSSILIHDGKYDEDVAKVTLTVIYNQVSKTAIVLKDVKILIDPKVLDYIDEITFSERYELDLARGINPSNEAYIHYFEEEETSVYQHPITGEYNYDIVQAFDPSESYIYFAGYWPNASEYSVYSPLVPDLPGGFTRNLAPGTKIADIPGIADMPPGPDEPSTPWVVVQWRYNAMEWPNLLNWLTNADEREMRFVEVIGMTDMTDNPHPAMDMDAGDGWDQVDTEVLYLLAQVFAPEDLNTITTIGDSGQYPFQWVGLGQSAATTDSGGAGLVGGNGFGWHATAMTLFDRADEMFPWIDPVISMRGTIPYGLDPFTGDYIESFSNAGEGTGADTMTQYRTGLLGFAFRRYDGEMDSPPQPIAGGPSRTTADWWYPSKDPLTERWAWTTSMSPYDTVMYHPNGILSLGGMKANGLTRYFNDFGEVITREGSDAFALVDGGMVTGSAPTSDPAKPTFDYYPLASWNSSRSTWNFGEGNAVISLVRDVNGTRGLSIYGWDGRDTFWATAWASQYLLGTTQNWLPAGCTALVLDIAYSGTEREPTGFTIVKAMGTITEFGVNQFWVDLGFDKPADWYGCVEPCSVDFVWPSGYPVWWYEKLPTDSDAKIEFDP
jgi:hypothetical protein